MKSCLTFFSERKKNSAKSQQRSIGLKEKALPQFQRKTNFDKNQCR